MVWRHYSVPRASLLIRLLSQTGDKNCQSLDKVVDALVTPGSFHGCILSFRPAYPFACLRRKIGATRTVAGSSDVSKEALCLIDVRPFADTVLAARQDVIAHSSVVGSCVAQI